MVARRSCEVRLYVKETKDHPRREQQRFQRGRRRALRHGPSTQGSRRLESAAMKRMTGGQGGQADEVPWRAVLCGAVQCRQGRAGQACVRACGCGEAARARASARACEPVCPCARADAARGPREKTLRRRSARRASTEQLAGRGRPSVPAGQRRPSRGRACMPSRPSRAGAARGDRFACCSKAHAPSSRATTHCILHLRHLQRRRPPDECCDAYLEPL